VSRAIEARWDDLSVVKAFDFLRGAVRARWGGRAEAAEAGWGALPPESVRAMQFHLHALRKMQDLADRHGFTFVNVFTYSGHILHETDYEWIQEEFCRAHGIAFLSLRPAFEEATRNGEAVFLRADGHLSDAGARLSARLLSQYVARHTTPDPRR
jgi:hypothetical protein